MNTNNAPERDAMFYAKLAGEALSLKENQIGGLALIFADAMTDALQPQMSESDEAVRLLRCFVPSEDHYLAGENPPSHVISAWNFLAKCDARHRQPAAVSADAVEYISDQLQRLKTNGGQEYMLTDKLGVFGCDFEWVLFYVDELGEKNLIPITSKGIHWNQSGIKRLCRALSPETVCGGE